MLVEAGADMEHRSLDGMAPLHLAAGLGHVEAVRVYSGILNLTPV